MAHSEVGKLLAAFKLGGYANIAAAEGYEDISDLPDAFEDFETLALAVGLKREHASRWGTFVAHCLAIRSNANGHIRTSLIEVARPEELLPPPPPYEPSVLTKNADADRLAQRPRSSLYDSMTRESIRREKVAAVTLPPCKSCGSPWAQERGFFCDGRHSRACRVCSTGYCADCKFIHMLKTSALAQTELLSTNMGSSGSGNGSSRSSGGGGGNNNPWVCRTCAGDMGFTVGGPCVVCEAPWVERSTFLGRNSMHSRECVACLRSFCHSCKLRHMVKEGTSAALMNRLRNGGGSNGCGGSFPGSFRESVSGGADSFTESRADFMRHSDGGSGGCGCGGGGGGGIGSRGSLANQPSGPHLARPQFRRYECLDCRAEHAYRPERGSNAESAQPQPPTPILQREAPPPYSRNSPSTISVNNNSGAIGGGGGSGGGGSGSGHAGQNAGEHKDASERQTNRHRSHESGNKTVNDRRMRAALKGEAATARPASSRTIAL